MAWFARTYLRCIAGIICLTSAAPGVSDAADAGIEVRCAGGRSFVVQVEPARAVVTMGPQRISLPRRQMPLAQYYRSDEAALVIDGAFVAFVPKGDESWRDCRMEAAGTALAN